MNSITNDPATWPIGDALWAVARAIAFAEGAHVAGSNPDRLNNPGDISDYYHVYGGEQHSGSKVTRFPTKQDGWNVLRNKLYGIMAGMSKVYKPDMTWTDIAMLWAANWQPWVANVTANLHVKPTDTFAEYVK